MDELNLEEGWDTYQGNEAMMRQALIVVCKATDMAITYFTQSAKENKNFLLIQDFVIWLVLQYNLEVEIICSNNKMNQIKTKDWCNNVDIFFELYALNTYVQNDCGAF